MYCDFDMYEKLIAMYNEVSKDTQEFIECLRCKVKLRPFSFWKTFKACPLCRAPKTQSK